MTDLKITDARAATVTVVPTCAAHPGAMFDACGACLREAQEGHLDADVEMVKAEAALDCGNVGSPNDCRLDAGNPRVNAAERCCACDRRGLEAALAHAREELAAAEAERDAAQREAAEAQALAAVVAPAEMAEARENDRESRRLLARQCDLAAETETQRMEAIRQRDAARREAAEAQAREDRLRRTAGALVNDCEATFELLTEAQSWVRTGGIQGYIADVFAALAHPTDHAALDALLAEARAEGRREGAQACVEAARAATSAVARLDAITDGATPELGARTLQVAPVRRGRRAAGQAVADEHPLLADHAVAGLQAGGFLACHGCSFGRRAPSLYPIQ